MMASLGSTVVGPVDARCALVIQPLLPRQAHPQEEVS
jgi:hypothetical protein